MAKQKQVNKNKKSSAVAVAAPASSQTLTKPEPTVAQGLEAKVTPEQLKSIQNLNESIAKVKNEFGNVMYNAKMLEVNYLNKIKEMELALQELVQKTAASYNLDLQSTAWNLDLNTGVFKKK